MTKIIVVLIYLACFANVKSEYGSTYMSKVSTYIYNCHQGEDLFFHLENDQAPSEEIEPVVVKVHGCSSATIDHFPGPIIEFVTKEFVFENIDKTLQYGLKMLVRNMTSMTFLNVGNVVWLEPESFSKVDILKKLHVENTKMELCYDIFDRTNVQNVVLKNVTMKNLKAIRLKSNNGEHLEIIDSRIKVTEGTYIFEGFKNISIKKTIFEFSKPGNIKLSGGEIILNRVTLINTSLDVIGTKKIDIRGTCSSGKDSRISLNSSTIFSHGNNVSNEITYIPKQREKRGHNKVCVDNDCNCNSNDDSKEPRKRNYAGTIHRNLFPLSALVSYFFLTRI